jgi:peptidoglycan hydrolase-like protein with peptidoglycan-binding domain
MAWEGYKLGMTGEQVRKIQDRLKRAYRSYAGNLEVTGTYDAATEAAVREFQRRAGLPVTGIANYATQVRLGVVLPAPPKLTRAYTVPGTWAGWNDGPPAWTAWGLDHNRFQQQGVGYPAMGFLQPNPNISYNESRDAGTAELLRLSLPDPNPKVWIGYSQGADVVVRALLAWPAERRNEIVKVISFGSPGRRPGPTLLGNNPPGAGISGVYTPDWAASRTYDFVIDGDMYPAAVGLLPALYDLLTRMDLSLEFATYLFQLLTSSVGGQLLGSVPGGNQPGAGSLSGLTGLLGIGGPQQLSLPGILLNLPGVLQTIVAALQFVMTNAHQHYADQPIFDGLTGVDRAIQIISQP